MGGIILLRICCLFLFVLNSINAAPSVVLTPSSLTTVAGENVDLNCVVTEKADYSIFWVIDLDLSSNNIVLAPTSSLIGYPRYSFTGNVASGESTLQITNVEDGDMGTYSCMVTSPDNDASKMVMATSTLAVGVLEVPTSGLQVSKSANLDFDTLTGGPSKGGENAVLSCKVTGGQPPPTVEWLRNGERMSEQTYSVDNGVTEARVEWTLTYLDSHANYTCRGDHPGWQDTQDFTYVDLNLVFSPVVNIAPAVQIIDVDQTAMFRCTVLAIPEESTYIWYYNDDVVTSENPRFNITSSGTALVLNLVTNSDYGSRVTCEATNAEGSNNKTSIIQEPSRLIQRDLELRYLIAVIVGVCGFIFLLALIISCCTWCTRSRRERRKNDPNRRDSYNLAERDGLNYDQFQGGAESRVDAYPNGAESRVDDYPNGGTSNPAAVTTDNVEVNVVEPSADPMYASVDKSKKGSIRSGSSSIEDNTHLSDTDTVPVVAPDDVATNGDNQTGGHVLY